MLIDEVKDTIASVAPSLRERGIIGLYLFGSAAHGEESEESDIDLFLDYDPSARFSLFDQMDIEVLLSARLGRKVDLLTRGGLHPLIKDEVVASATRLF